MREYPKPFKKCSRLFAERRELHAFHETAVRARESKESGKTAVGISIHIVKESEHAETN
jgi:hypothetical protein